MGRILPRRPARSLAPAQGKGIEKYLGVLKAIGSTVPFINPLFKGIWRAAHSPSASPRSRAAAEKLIEGLTPEQKAKLDELRAEQSGRSAQRVGGLVTPLGRAPIAPVPLGGRVAPGRPRTAPAPISPMREPLAEAEVLGGRRLMGFDPGGLKLKPELMVGTKRPPLDLTQQVKRKAIGILAAVPGIEALIPDATVVVDILSNPAHPQYDETVQRVRPISGHGALYGAGHRVIQMLAATDLSSWPEAGELPAPPPVPKMRPGAPAPPPIARGAPVGPELGTEFMRREEPVERPVEVPAPPAAPPSELFDVDVPIIEGEIDIGELARRFRERNIDIRVEGDREGGLPEDLSRYSLAQLRAMRKLAQSPDDVHRIGQAARARGKYEMAPGIFEAIGGKTGAEEGERFVLAELGKPMTRLEIMALQAKIADLRAKGRWREAGTLLRRAQALGVDAQVGLTEAKTVLTWAQIDKLMRKLQRRRGGGASMLRIAKELVDNKYVEVRMVKTGSGSWPRYELTEAGRKALKKDPSIGRKYRRLSEWAAPKKRTRGLMREGRAFTFAEAMRVWRGKKAAFEKKLGERKLSLKEKAAALKAWKALNEKPDEDDRSFGK
jgi:DNA-binding PadR family transcriptional regulator